MDNEKTTAKLPSSLLQQLNIELVLVKEAESKHFPQGPFVAISRHLAGDLDYLLLLYAMQGAPADSKVLTYGEVPQTVATGNSMLAVENRKISKEINQMLQPSHPLGGHINGGGAIGFFPARKHRVTKEGRVVDKLWEPNIIKLIRDLKLPVVPISFQATNPKALAQLVAHLKGGIKTPAPAEKVIINVRIGTAITVDEINEFARPSRLSRFLRARTAALGTPIEVEQFYLPGNTATDTAQPLAPVGDAAMIAKEIDQIRANNLLFTQAEFELFTARASQIPHALLEIGRLRELTFREVLEGSNKPRDLDEYDLYYDQLIIWDKTAQQIVGGYRIGRGDFIYQSYGVKGFYIGSLFKFAKPFHPILKESIELGRAYIVPEYQRKRLPLFLLWRGILAFVTQNPQFKYLIGPLSISKMYSDISKQLIIEFVKKHYYHHKLAQHVKPRKPYKVTIEDIDTDILIENFEGEIQKLDNFIEDIEPFQLRIPVLMKKYIKQKARIICFNVDPSFSDTLDGLMLLDLAELPAETIEALKID